MSDEEEVHRLVNNSFTTTVQNSMYISRRDVIGFPVALAANDVTATRNRPSQLLKLDRAKNNLVSIEVVLALGDVEFLRV